MIIHPVGGWSRRAALAKAIADAWPLETILQAVIARQFSKVFQQRGPDL
jgi:hypothetical protein